MQVMKLFIPHKYLQLLTDSLFWLIQTKMIMQKYKNLKDIIYQKVLLRVATSSSTEKAFMANDISKSILCDSNIAYILVKGNITIAGNIAAQVEFENCAPFTKC